MASSSSKGAAEAEHKTGYKSDGGLVACRCLVWPTLGLGRDSNGTRAIRKMLGLHLETEEPVFLYCLDRLFVHFQSP